MPCQRHHLARFSIKPLATTTKRASSLRQPSHDAKSGLGSAATRVHVEVLERRANGRPVFAAVFPQLHAGSYEIWGKNAPNPSGNATIVGGRVTTVDWCY